MITSFDAADNPDIDATAHAIMLAGDMDKDGSLSFAESSAIATSGMPRRDTDVSQHVFHQVDSNEDSLLSDDELKEFVKLTVGSQKAGLSTEVSGGGDLAANWTWNANWWKFQTPPTCTPQTNNQECCIPYRGHDGCAKGKDGGCGGCHRVHLDGKWQNGFSSTSKNGPEASCGRSQDCVPITVASGSHQAYHSVCIHNRCRGGLAYHVCGNGHDCLSGVCKCLPGMQKGFGPFSWCANAKR
jgi:hypothetical protein